MGQLNLAGTLNAGPPAGGETFPASQMIVPLAFLNGAMSYGVASGVLTQIVNSPSAFVPLVGVGPTAAVTQGSMLYLKCDGPMLLQLTNDDGSGGQDVQVVPVHGISILQFPTTRPLEALDVQGSGKIEYLVVGAS